MKTQVAASVLAILGGATALLVPSTSNAGNVGYFKNEGGCTGFVGDPSAAITAAGHTPVAIASLFAGLNQSIQIPPGLFERLQPAREHLADHGRVLDQEAGDAPAGGQVELPVLDERGNHCGDDARERGHGGHVARSGIAGGLSRRRATPVLLEPAQVQRVRELRVGDGRQRGEPWTRTRCVNATTAWRSVAWPWV